MKSTLKMKTKKATLIAFALPMWGSLTVFAGPMACLIAAIDCAGAVNNAIQDAKQPKDKQDPVGRVIDGLTCGVAVGLCVAPTP